MKIKPTFLFLLVFGLAPLNAAIPPVIFMDGEFSEAAWSSDAIRLQGGSPTGIAFQQTVAGNPGAYWRNEIDLVVGDGMRMEHRADFAVYDPSSQGAIEKIDYSLDSAFFSSGNYAHHLLLRQDGNNYYFSMPRVSGGTWTTQEVVTLTDINFFHRDNRSIHPDFSETGAPIEFGFTRQVFLNSGSTFAGRHGADNWDVTVHRNERVNFIPATSDWNYLDDGSDQGRSTDGTNWFAHPDYEDSTWETSTLR